MMNGCLMEWVVRVMVVCGWGRMWSSAEGISSGRGEGGSVYASASSYTHFQFLLVCEKDL